MRIDWTLFARYAAPIVALFAGAVLNRLLERREKLISYLWHANAVTVRPPGGVPQAVHMHSIVVRNAGRTPSLNVRIGHTVLPDFSVFPSVAYEVHELASGGKEILFPSLVPGEQVIVAYLYFPPLLWSGVNTYTKSDGGLAKILQVLPTPQPSRRLQLIAGVLMLLGTVTLIYAAGQILRFLFRF